MNLETSYYVTDQIQAADFNHVRDSGLVVNIGIHNILLLPQYDDEDHESDNHYMQTNPNNSEDKLKFRNIIDHQCRSAIQT